MGIKEMVRLSFKQIRQHFLESFLIICVLFPTDTGSPQGGSISSIYAETYYKAFKKLHKKCHTEML